MVPWSVTTRGGAAALGDDAGDGDAFLDGDAAGARRFGVGLGQPVGIDVAVAGDEGRALDAVGGDEREQRLGLVGRERVALDAKALGLRHRAADFAPAVGRGCEAERADLAPLDGVAGLGREPVEHGDRGLHQPREVALAAELADEAGGMPGAAFGELALFEQQHVALALAAQRIGDGAADGAAADDDDPGVAVDGCGHAFTRALVGS